MRRCNSTPNGSTKRKQLSQKRQTSKQVKLTEKQVVKSVEEESDTEGEINWKEVEEEIERNASKANLTATNVKSIIRVSVLPSLRLVNSSKATNKVS